MDTAARQFGAARDLLAALVGDYPDLRPRLLALDEAVGVAHMRQGEIDNCLVNPSADRCLFPLRPGGAPPAAAGAEAARERFEAYLRPRPRRPRGALAAEPRVHGAGPLPPGRAPGAAPAPPTCSAPEAGMPRFIDVAARGRARRHGHRRRDRSRTTSTATACSTSCFSSVDYCSPLRLFRNRGDGTFEDRTERGRARWASSAASTSCRPTTTTTAGSTSSCMRGGWEVPMRNSLLRNNGDGTFTDVTRAAGLPSGAHATHSAAWADYDNDGWLDLFVGHELTPSQLFRNHGDGTFEDVTRAGRRRRRPPSPRASTWGDYDNDGFPDLYVSNMFGRQLPLPQQRRRHVHGRGREARRRRSRSPASRPGSSTTTTTAGSTSSSSRYPTSVDGVRQALPRAAAAARRR